MRGRMRWMVAALALGIAAVISTACAGQAEPRVAPASDRPTFVWIFSDP
jgi:hypothetical protein